MLIIGLTGSLATGKSTVASLFRDRGAKVIDADRIAHQLMKRNGNCYKAIVQKFGKGILTKGSIDRKKLAAVVFADSRKRKTLERIIHPAVTKEIRKSIELFKKRSSKGIVVLDVPLLFESGLDQYVDVIIVVKARRIDQITRAVNHLKITKKEAQRRIAAQMPLNEKIRRADIIIDNNQSKRKTKNEVDEIWLRARRKKINQ